MVAATDRPRKLPTGLLTPLAIAVYVGVIFWVIAFQWSNGRWDYYFLAEAFLEGRTWVDPLGPGFADTVVIGDRAYVPFPPFPAVVLMPLVWLVGAAAVLPWEQTINVALAATTVALFWVLLGRVERLSASARMWLIVLFALSTPMWWITVRGGPWHFAQLLATLVTLVGLMETFGRRRPWVLGMVAAASFLTRPTLLFALPFYVAVAVRGREERVPKVGPEHFRRAAMTVLPVVVAIGVSLLYNAARFGSPLESGYSLANLPPELVDSRSHGLFSLAYLERNIGSFLFTLPVFGGSPWPAHPSGFGLSVLITSPALLLALFADYGRRINIALAATAFLVLIPSLLYYGGGWLQLGFRYFLDSIPFVMLLVASGAARRFGWPWKVLIGAGTLVSLWGILSAGQG